MYTLYIILSFIPIIFSTKVRGPVFKNTVWQKLNNPYVLVGDFQIPERVTLTILEGTQVMFPGDYQLLIKGKLKIQGTIANPVKFSGNETDRAMILFKSTNLSDSTITNCQFYGSKSAIQLGEETESNPDSIKNSGNLRLSRILLVNSKIQTNGIRTTASLNIDSSIITNSTIIGVYPLSEPISITKTTVNSSLIKSDSYNNGIKIHSSKIIKSNFYLGCCGANIEVKNTQINTLNVNGNVGYDMIDGSLSLQGCKGNNMNINLPHSPVKIDKCEINNNMNEKILVGLVNISCSIISGNQKQTGIEINGIYYYNPSDLPQQILKSTITNFQIGIFVKGSQTNLVIQNTNLFNNKQYNIYTISPKNIKAINNWWGKNTSTTIKKTIYDYYKNINYGKVLFNPFVSSKIINQQC